MHSSLYRSGKSRRFNHNKFQRSQILSNGSFPCPLKGEILLQTINSHKKLKCYLTWLLIFFLFFFWGPHTSILTLSLLLSYTFAYSIIIVSVSFLSTFISLIHKSLLSSLFIFLFFHDLHPLIYSAFFLPPFQPHFFPSSLLQHLPYIHISSVLSNFWMKLSMISWLIKIKFWVICQSIRLKTEFNNCFIIHFLTICERRHFFLSLKEFENTDKRLVN